MHDMGSSDLRMYGLWRSVYTTVEPSRVTGDSDEESVHTPSSAPR